MFIFLVSIKIMYTDRISYILLLVYYFKIRVNHIIYRDLTILTLLERPTHRVKFIDRHFSRFNMSQTIHIRIYILDNYRIPIIRHLFENASFCHNN